MREMYSRFTTDSRFNFMLSHFRLLRPEVLLAAVLWEDSEAINQAKQLLHNFLNKGQVIPANLREVRLEIKITLQSGLMRFNSNYVNEMFNCLTGCIHGCSAVR